MTIWFASGNIHKKQELEKIFGVELKIPKEAGLDFDPVETGSTFLENSLLKAKELRRLLEEKRRTSPTLLYSSEDLILADDSGICVDALDGRPGIFSARYSGAETMDDTEKKLSDTERNALLLSEIGDNPLRTARFVCAMVLLYGAPPPSNGDRFFAVQETVEGEIVKNAEAIRGKGGFGYDPIFFIPELNRTAAELSEEEKNIYSHRGKAGRAIRKMLAD